MSQKTLPVFDPKTVAQEATSAVVWVPQVVESPYSVSVFSPEFMTDKPSLAVFGYEYTPDSSIPVFGPPAGAAESNVVTAARKPTPPQGQREMDRVIRRFLKRIKATDIRFRRVGHTTYTWKHINDPEPGDTGSDVRWEIKLSGTTAHMGVYDIKPFFRVVTGPFDVDQLCGVHKSILKEMDADAGE